MVLRADRTARRRLPPGSQHQRHLSPQKATFGGRPRTAQLVTPHFFAPMYRRGSFSVILSLDDALGPDYLRLVEGVRRADGRIVDVDFEGGLLLAIFRLEPSGAPVLVTMYPVGR